MTDARPLAFEGNAGFGPVYIRPLWNRIRNSAARWAGAPHAASRIRRNDRLANSHAGGREKRKGEKMSERPVRDWMDEHPWTTLYIAVVVTILLILQIAESLS